MIERKASEQARLILFSACVTALLSLISVSVSDSDFKISIAIILLPVLAALIDDFPLLRTAAAAALAVYGLRVLVLWLASASLGESLLAYWPEMFFYFGYGLLLAAYRHWLRPRLRWPGMFAALCLIDLGANLLELALRGSWPDGEMLLQLLAVALGRSVVAAALICAFNRYGFVLLKQEDSRRYRRLLLLTAKLKGELAWLQKGERQIEQTMSRAYGLYQRLGREGGAQQDRDDALTIAKDIHEIKKEYLLIVRGIRDSLEQGQQQDTMSFGAIYQLLCESVERWAAAEGRQVEFQLDAPVDMQTGQYEALLSIFHNLYQNAVEAGAGGSILIRTSLEDRSKSWHFTVADNAGGIRHEPLEQIFLPGFSSKLDVQTGAVQRGLGLSLVRDLVEEQLSGTIEVETDERGTIFRINIPKRTLEVVG